MPCIRKVIMTIVIAAVLGFSPMSQRDANADELTPNTFSKLQNLIKPQPDESRWMNIPWETNLNAARRKAAELGKPLLIWAGGGSAPLGGC